MVSVSERHAPSLELRSSAISASPTQTGWHRKPLAEVFLTGAAIVGIVLAINLITPHAVGVLIAILFATPWIWRYPVRGLYLLIGGASTIEIFPLRFPDSFTDNVPLFQNLNNSLGLNGFSATPVEILMLVVAVIWIMRAAEAHTLRLPQSRLLAAYLVFAACVLIAELRGLFVGGDFNVSLWEFRPQAYGFAMFLLTSMMITQRREIERLALIVMVAILIKAVIADWRYFITLHSMLGAHDGALAHEDSFFLALFPTAALASVIWSPGRFTKLLILSTPLVIVGELVDERRAGIAAMVTAIAVVLILAIRFQPVNRKRLILLSAILVAATASFIAVNWDHQTGATGQLIRPVRSLIDPTVRDYLSDAYRQAENENLIVSFRSSPVIGMGFGIPYLTPYPMADISQIYPLWNYIPHNSLYWIAVRMGTIGYVAFWCLVGLAVLSATQFLRVPSARFTRALAAVAVAAIVAELIVGYTDIQLENYRNMIFFGALLGVLSVLPQLEEKAVA